MDFGRRTGLQSAAMVARSAIGRSSAARALYRAEVSRRVAARAPIAFGVLVACGGLAAVFEILRFPEREAWMLGAEASYVVIAIGTLALLRALPHRSVGILIGAINVLGLILNAYHAIVGAQVAMCIWTLTALLCSAVMILPWGWRAQALASLGVLLGYPLLLRSGQDAFLSWAAGGVYLGWVVGLGTTGAGFIDRYLATDFELASALSERESRLQSYFDLSLVGTAILSPEGALLEVNEELCRILGYDRESLLRARWSVLIPPADAAIDRTQLDAALHADPSAAVHERALLRRDGSRIDAIISVRGLPGPLGPADHLIVVVQDVTARRQAEREREEALVREQAARRDAETASRAKDDFLAIASHELRTPLTPILGWTPMLRAGWLDAEQQARAYASIERSGRSLAQLIGDLLDVSRIVSGKLRLAVRPTEVGPIVEAALESMHPAADAKGVHLDLHLTGGHARVSGDPDRLQQVVWNLVSNAIKFTESGGRVRIDVESAGGYVEIRVRDTGRGIEFDLLPHVFQRFWQADTAVTRRHGGLGLGLAIVRHLVELHGGTVAAESGGIGRGALFTVRLPAIAAAGRGAGGPTGPVIGALRTLAGVRVLVVDDEADAQEVARTALELCGVEVRTAGSAMQALEVLECWVPTVLVSDIAMPNEDGYALIRRVRAHEAAHGGHVPALAFTALARAEDRTRVLAAGFDGYVTKPIDPVQLIDAVAGAAAGPGSGGDAAEPLAPAQLAHGGRLLPERPVGTTR